MISGLRFLIIVNKAAAFDGDYTRNIFELRIIRMNSKVVI